MCVGCACVCVRAFVRACVRAYMHTYIYIRMSRVWDSLIVMESGCVKNHCMPKSYILL